MPLYRATFERTNWGFRPPLKQSSDVLLQTDIPYDDDNLAAFEEALWVAMREQNPHWCNPAGPKGAAMGWSSVMGSGKVERVDEDAHMAVVWHIPQSAWLKADGETATVDVDEAGRFSSAQILELQAKYPGERYSMVMPKLLAEVYRGPAPKDGCGGWELQVRFDELVVWGCGPRRPDGRGAFETVTLAKTGGGLLSMEFKLPEATEYRPDPQVYERKSSWAWRFIHGGVGFGEPWNLAEGPEEAVTAAREIGVKEMRRDGHHYCWMFLASKHAVNLKDTRSGPAPTCIFD
ncbi:MULTISPECIES: hypothetical protein [unclassified Variovorax]|uniref:hypothetical protein n=1 Tax=unclassified Variovorax TaxID=663243 RepID=UPI00076CA06F|nr:MULTISPECIES: hypothetical protein [unclassified Variovorax]KWT98103.1 hypothetical protein APY03_0774 [Variovorax sp. WDL1]PNG50421.1 hypothetical protein CHC06_06045 [Variovorax sp. B2]